jgi:hypothetical protein
VPGNQEYFIDILVGDPTNAWDGNQITETNTGHVLPGKEAAHASNEFSHASGYLLAGPDNLSLTITPLGGNSRLNYGFIMPGTQKRTLDHFYHKKFEDIVLTDDEIWLKDSQKVRFGNSDDGFIYYDGSANDLIIGNDQGGGRALQISGWITQIWGGYYNIRPANDAFIAFGENGFEQGGLNAQIRNFGASSLSGIEITAGGAADFIAQFYKVGDASPHNIVLYGDVKTSTAQGGTGEISGVTIGAATLKVKGEDTDTRYATAAGLYQQMGTGDFDGNSIPSSSIGVEYQISGWTEGHASSQALTSTSGVKLLAEGVYKVDWSLVWQSMNSTQQAFRVRVALNGTSFRGSQQTYLSTGQGPSKWRGLNGTFIVSGVTVNDEISLVGSNISKTEHIMIDDGQFNVTKVG